ncbi:Pyruvate, water dikinase [Solidesulfovibrio carbinoliphilus subsp. oakridgensis]|uniref:Phosphoenolpyruvate synthase n=1 Tax=Solidesulfovibrio carbinoliphilus subsp. oakridgensis TaxID=694327 RepID=G7Q8J9_9BACT|nr:Pyruvate, water dikinase [Solidesulfovibrio carbinoliphilus subsp. oakridgensis]
MPAPQTADSGLFVFSKELFRRWTYQVFAPGVLLREKYNAFRELLRFDDACLELIAAIEDIHYGQAAVDWARVVHLARRLRISVEEMVARLTRLSPAHHLDLPEYAKKVDFYVQMALDVPAGDMAPPFVVPLPEVAGDAARAGGKAANLARAGRLGRVAVPPGFVVTTGAFRYFLEAGELRPKIDRWLRRVDLARPNELAEAAAEIRRLILGARLPDEVAGPLAEAARALAVGPDGEPLLLAARSSAVAEDGRASFAGQYESLLDVPPDEAATAYLRVVAGKYAAKAITYRVLTGYADEETPMAVLFLPMVPAVASGVLYTRDSADEDAPMAAYAVPGLGADLVGGATTPERLALSRRPPHILLDRHTLDAPVLPEAAARKLAALGLALENAFEAPQDVEWVLGPAGALTVLQSRPMAVEGAPAVAPPPRPDVPPLVVGGGRASGGAAAGTVRFAATVLDVADIPPGTVLVTPTLPPALARAADRLAAVVAVAGSRAGHFASVARELGLPVVTGVEDAFHALAEGAVVTVDADAGAVYPGRVASLLARPRQNRPSEGSPVAERLGRLVPLIAGLTLTDPASPDFAPSRVKSLHDIVRFAHEKAVTEMFSLVGPGARGLASARKLKSHLPMTMYLLDLGGGVFESAAKDKELRPDQIRSAPMWALWSGLAADDTPWPEGPPITDDTAFDQTSGGIFASDSKHLASYAVVSDLYAHVMLRFGYHFTVVDALCGPAESQNFVNFRFKGGGAGYEQRTLRLSCVRRILTHFGFTVRTSGDLLDASLARVPEHLVQKRLAMLGCLLAATRLLDMRLSGEADADAWVDRFLARTDR